MSDIVKITILKKMVLDDVVEQYAEKPIPVCSKFQEGDSFLTDGRTIPEGFCTWAWADIFKDIIFVRNHMECIGTKGRQSQVVSCTDGFRPVIFLIEPCQE